MQLTRTTRLTIVFQKLLKTACMVFFSTIIFASVTSASEMTSKELAKNTFDLANYKGQFVYLDFWASWCGPCRASFPWMNTLQKELENSNLKIVSINLDADREDANAFLQEFPADFDVIFDPEGQYAKNYELLGMPSSFFFDPTGKLLFSHIGFNHKDAPELKEKIQTAINSISTNTQP